VRIAAVSALAVAALAGCGGGHGPASVPGPGSVQAALLARLEARGLAPRYVRCADSGRRVDGQPVFRCNVNFGDPRISPYCALLRDGALVTQVERPLLRCGRVRPGPGADTPP
jgi:hypothetical protein